MTKKLSTSYRPPEIFTPGVLPNLTPDEIDDFITFLTIESDLKKFADAGIGFKLMMLRAFKNLNKKQLNKLRK